MSRQRKGNRNPGNVETRISDLLAGIKTHLPKSKALDVAGAELTPDKITKELESRLSPYLVADQAHLAARKAVQARDAAEPETLKFVENIENALKAHFGATSADLENFGIAPKRPRAKGTRESQANRVAPPAPPATP